MKPSKKRKKSKAKGLKKPVDLPASPPWFKEGLGEWASAAILEGLREEGLPLDEDTFRVEAGEVSDPDELVSLWAQRIDRGPGRWEDFFQLAARELWRRLLPDRDYFEWFVDDWEAYLGKRQERPEKKWTPADMPELATMLDRLDRFLETLSLNHGLPKQEILDGFSNEYNYELLSWLIELPLELAGDGFLDQAVETARRYAFADPKNFLGDLGWILAEAGRCEEALSQIEENLNNYPDDPWMVIKAGDVLDLCGQAERAERLYLQALGMTEDKYTLDGAIERLVPLYEQWGKPEKIDELKKRFPPEEAYLVDGERRTPKVEPGSSSVTLPKKPKIGRNDPCPCGSGKKFKKCCLLKDND